MQHAIRTRGKSAGDNDYRWRFAAGKQFSVDINGKGFHEFLNDNGVLVYLNADGTCCVFMLSRPSEAATDYQNRGIRVGLLVSQCPIPIARGLFAYGLTHLDNYLNDFQSFVNNFGQDDWQVNEETIIKFIENIEPIESMGAVFSQRTENACTEENRNKLFDEITQYDFSSGEGFKLIADNGLMTGGNLKLLRSQVNRYLAGKSSEKVLGIIKPVKPPIWDSVKKFVNKAAKFLPSCGSKTKSDVEKIDALEKRVQALEEEIEKLKNNRISK